MHRLPVLRIPRSTVARPVRLARPGRPGHGRSRRRWSRRGRRGQVAPVATVLGLLLVVTFIANYLSTTLPNQMSVNDLNHEIQVGDQVARLSVLMTALAESRRIGAQVSQPITLGSAGAPPFAGPDGGVLEPLPSGSTLRVNYTLSGPTTFTPPTLGPLTGSVSCPGEPGCLTTCPTPTSTSFAETGTCYLTWNFTGGSGTTFSFGQTGSGSDAVTVGASSSTITVTGTGSGQNTYQFLGSHDTITMTGVGTGPTTITVVGSYDSLSISTVGTSPVNVLIVGNNDPVTVSSTGSGAVHVYVYGTSDTFGVSSDTGNQVFTVAFNGFNATNPTSSKCPYGNLSSTDKVTGFSETGSGGLTEYLNDSTGYYANSTGSGSCTGNSTCWAIHSRNVALSTCPFFSPLTLPVAATGLESAGIVVHLANTYSPVAEVAYDEGAVVYAQIGGVPILTEAPGLTLVNQSLTVFLPQFEGSFVAESGVSTALISMRLDSAQTISLPVGQFTLLSGSRVTVTLVTPYAAGWRAYFTNNPAWAGVSMMCAGPSNVCTATYTGSGALGTIVLSIPATSLTVTTALYSISAH